MELSSLLLSLLVSRGTYNQLPGYNESTFTTCVKIRFKNKMQNWVMGHYQIRSKGTWLSPCMTKSYFVPFVFYLEPFWEKTAPPSKVAPFCKTAPGWAVLALFFSVPVLKIVKDAVTLGPWSFGTPLTCWRWELHKAGCSGIMANGDYWGLMGICFHPNNLNGDYWGLLGINGALIPKSKGHINPY